MNPPSKTNVKRILVAVDTSPRSLAPLEMAVNLAARMQAQLETLFIEDMNLLNLAGLPFAKELDRTSGEARALNAPNITYALQNQAQRLRQLLQTFSEQKQIKTNLRVVRGNYFTEAMHAKADILFMLTSKRVSVTTPGQPAKSGSVSMRFWNAAPVYVYYTGGSESERPLSLASDLAEILGTEVMVLLPANNEKTITALKKRARKILGGKSPIRYEIIDTDLATTAKKIAASGCSLLVLPKYDTRSKLHEIQALESIHCPVVLVA
ncbi:MAG: universal stress protein [Gammaproteobacteria bacterium]|nr:universal stress protein [Gammaproteobacteria bacterium]